MANPEIAPDIRPSGFFVFRTPLLPYEELEAWSEGLEAPAALTSGDPAELERAVAADRERLRARLRALIERPEVLEALFLASPSLVDSLALWREQPDSKKGLRAERALVRYIYRMAARATPFGLFSGCSLGEIDPAPDAPTRLMVGPRASYERHTRLDMDYLFALCEELGRDPGLRRQLVYRPNSSLYKAGGRLRYAEARLERKIRSHHLVAVDPTDYLDEVLRRASGGARMAELADALVAFDPDGEVSPEEAIDFLVELIDSQLLVSDLSPPVTGPEAVHDLIGQLAQLEGGEPAAERLARARDVLAELDSGGPGSSPDRYRAIAQDLEALPTPVEMARLFQLDMIKPADHPVVGKAVLDEVVRGIGLLRRFASRRTEQFEAFRKDFTDRYGDDREVPLVEVLDEEIGIGYEKSSDAGAEASPLLHGIAIAAPAAEQTVPWGTRESFLLAKLTETLAAGGREIVLTPQDLDRMAPPPREEEPPLPPLADAFQVMATIAAASEEALAAGDFEVLLGGAVGPSGARLLGRFCHADPALHHRVEEHLRAEEAFRPEAIYAEVVHLPQGRIGNILSRPVLREHEIPFLGRSAAPQEMQIPITDLMVSVAGPRVVLRSQRLGREVIPRLTSAHNYRFGSLGIYRFLCMLQSQGVQGGAGWNWGPLESAPFLPRVRTGRLILTRASWWMTGDEIKQLVAAKGDARFAAVEEWRQQRGLPHLASLADGDNELLIDFDNVLSVETFLDVVEDRDRARLLEAYPVPDQLCSRGPEGRFVHELLLPFEAVQQEARQEARRRLPAAASAVRRSFPPGSEWLYTKLYTGTSTADRILCEALAPVVRQALDMGAVDSWFFIRYSDPGWHLRVRFHGDPRRLQTEVLPAIDEAVAPLLADGRMWKLQLDTYERETERYGGPEGIVLAERLFQIDSEAVLEIVEMIEGDEGADARWRIALRGTDMLLADLGLTDEAKAQAMEGMGRSFQREFRGGKGLRVQLDQKLRGESRSLHALLDPANDAESPIVPALEVLHRRSQAFAPIVAELKRLEAEGRLTSTIAEMAPSYVHMHLNRIIRSAARAHEMVIYSFLTQLYKSRAARKRKSGAAQEQATP